MARASFFPADRGHRQQRLQVMDMTAKQAQDLPLADGLWSPRWAPDGRSLATLDPSAHLCLYSLATHQRQELTSFSVGFPSWSADGRSLYFESGAMSQWFRLILKNRKLERLADLSGIQMDPAGFGWVGLLPNGDRISARRVNSNIYRLDFTEK